MIILHVFNIDIQIPTNIMSNVVSNQLTIILLKFLVLVYIFYTFNIVKIKNIVMKKRIITSHISFLIIECCQKEGWKCLKRLMNILNKF